VFMILVVLCELLGNIIVIVLLFVVFVMMWLLVMM